MSKSLSDRARMFTKRLSASKRITTRPQQQARTRLMLEALEDRTLLSTAGTESIVQSPLAEAGSYAIQAAVNYVSSYGSTVATMSQLLVNLEQQALLAVYRIESMAFMTVEQLIQQTLSPTSAQSSPSVLTSSTSSGQSGRTILGLASRAQETGSVTASPGNKDGSLPVSDLGTSSESNSRQPTQAKASSATTSQTLTPAAGTWTQLTNPAPDSVGIGTMILLSNGDMMGQGGGGTGLYPSTAWYELTPNATGSYVNGTWSNLASMSTERTFYGSNVLPDGKVFVVGGEHTAPGGNAGWLMINTGEIYDPVSDSWSPIQSVPTPLTTAGSQTTPTSQFGDDPTEVLPDGNILAGYFDGSQTYIYNPSTNSWSSGPQKLNGDLSDEETWTKLPNGDILSYSIYASVWKNSSQAQFYDPSTNSWTATGAVPVQLSSSPGYELGPALLLPDGRVFQLGANGNTAFYTPSSNSWTAGPVIPDGLVAADVPGAMLPNGDVLFAASTGSQNFPVSVFEFDPSTNAYTNVTPSDSNLNSNYNFRTRMLMLPTGQVLFSDGSNQLWVYTPSGSPSSPWQPTITGVTKNGDGTFTLTGTRLNGISEGASYGDDAEMSSNYPIVQLTASNGDVYYGRTHNWSSNGVSAAGDTTSETVNFTLPTNLPQGTYQLSVVANGIASASVNFNPANSGWTQVNLGSYYNTYGLSWGHGTSTPGIDGKGDTLEGYYTFGWQGTTLTFGTVGAEDVVSANQGQTIDINPQAGQYSTLTLFATAVNGDQSGQKFTVNYSSGPSQTFTRYLTNWLSLPGQSDEVEAFHTNAFNSTGGVLGTGYFSAFALPLDPTRTVTSITLPDDSNVVIFAMQLT